MPFITIDSVLSGSRLRLLWWLGAAVGLTLLTLALPIGQAYQLAITALLWACLWVGQLWQPHLLALSSTFDSNASDGANGLAVWDWQLQVAQGYIRVPFGQTHDVWQAKLTAVEDIGAVLLLRFWLFEPFGKFLTVQIWQDQVDTDTWRQLKTLAH